MRGWKARPISARSCCASRAECRARVPGRPLARAQCPPPCIFARDGANSGRGRIKTRERKRWLRARAGRMRMIRGAMEAA